VKIQLNNGNLAAKTGDLTKFLSCLADDFNTSNALANLYENVKLANGELRKNPINLSELEKLFDTLTRMLNVLGTEIVYPVLSNEDKKMYQEYMDLKAQKRFDESDKLRDALIKKEII
jgi:cysteinyl-tRNA synthetase